MLPILLAVLLGPFTAASNFSVDLLGDPDTRPGTWGYAGAQSWPVTFHPPDGYRVRVLGISGDLVAWPRLLQPEPPAAGSYAGVSLGFQTTAPSGSAQCDPCADNTFVYLQTGVGREPARISYDRGVDVLLGIDNVMVVAVSSWLNSGRYIHIEPTFVVKYQFEKKE